jgi:PAS domain S-box-containing protein
MNADKSAPPIGSPPPWDVLALSVQQSPFLVVITNEEGHLQYCNESYCRTSGYILEELLGTANLLDHVLTLTAGEQWQGDVLSLRKDRSEYWVRQIVSPLCDAEGRITHLVSLGQDITHSKVRMEDAEQALLLREQALVSSSNGIMITRSDENLVAASIIALVSAISR